MRNTYEERAKKFIRQIFDYIEMCTSYDDYEWATLMFNEDHHRAVKFAHGMTRVAFVTSDYVVKFDFPEYRGCVEKFGGCENEVEIYKEAQEDGFDYLFAKISRYKYMGVNFYIMPRINNVGKYWRNAEDYIMDGEALDWLYDHGINDLHNNNYGWLNGEIVIFDYACRR